MTPFRRRRKKYKYFISYTWQGDKREGKGFVVLDLNNKLSSGKDIEAVSDAIVESREGKFRDSNVTLIINNFILMNE